ncbi:MAG TPA: maleylpyruvate isomerase family mycothiol-dependent enzyme [Micromonosporaceae bacterium]
MSRIQGGKEFWLAALRAEGAAFVAAVSEPDVLTAPVPSCPDWTVGELVRHLGGFYHRIRLHAGSGGADDQWPALAVPDEAPAADDPAVLAWLREQLAGIEAHLEALDPDLPTYNWAPRPRVAAFWHRRAAHETAVHRWDAQVATRLPEPIEAKLAGDTVAEALDTFLLAGRYRTDPPVHGLVQLAATDLGVD